jgi:Predicted membrane protein/domain
MLDYVLIYIFLLAGMIAVGTISAIASISNRSSSSSGLLCLYLPLSFVLIILYFALMESSTAQGSLGKMAVDMKVVDMDGNRISFGKAIVRQIGKIVSLLIIGLGFVMCGFTEKRQGLHDMFAGTLVVMKKPVYFVAPPVESESGR